MKISTFYRTKVGDLAPLHKGVRFRDPDYMEGSIELTINNKIIVPRDYWDYIDQLWCYIANAALLMKGGEREVQISYPDQPVYLNFIRQADPFILIKWTAMNEVRQSSVKYEDFMTEVSSAGVIFFEEMMSANSAKRASYQYELQRLKSIRVDRL